MTPVDREHRLDAIHDHYCGFFEGREHEGFQWTLGPVPEIAPWFRVLRFAPSVQSDLWAYLSVGASFMREAADSLLEFVILADTQQPRFVELVTMVAYYHRTQGLGFGHTLPIGEPWLEGSLCDHMLVSEPYPLGPELEILNLEDSHIHVLWLLPITKRECEFKAEAGLEALEQRFERAQLRYWDPLRLSVI